VFTETLFHLALDDTFTVEMSASDMQKGLAYAVWSCCSGAYLLFSFLSPPGLNPIKLAHDPHAGWLS